MNFKNKYLKYKKKYLNIKKLLGGNIFNKIYDKLIKTFRDINKINDPIFGFKDIIHIKGGSSIKYHLQKNMIAPDDLNELTNDIDILVILDDSKSENLELFNKNKKDFVIFILETIKKNIPEYNWIYKESNQLYNICIENDIIECFIDITFYNPFDEDIDIDDDTSLFQYALRKNTYINMKNYIDKIKTNASIDSEFDITDDNIDTFMFTSPQFEYYSCIKGIELMGKYLNYASQKWNLEKEELKKILLENISLDDESINNIKKQLKRLEYQISEEYTNKLKDKLKRYNKKLELIKLIL
jgi:hypothetical protein